ncbi:MAG: Rieske 2Fe-2S domain-containing protein [Dehalococcoidales bacterium]|nr:Rieske 2Fe-2S domain-containing protein [Dehalococcoidales bacterium]
MGKLARIADINDLSEGTMKKYQLQDTEILVTRIAGKYYATQSKCPHFGGDLSKGKLEGSTVTCPKHGSQFNLTDGSVVRWLKGTGLISYIGKTVKSPQKLLIYNVKIEGQDIMVEI